MAIRLCDLAIILGSPAGVLVQGYGARHHVCRARRRDGIRVPSELICGEFEHAAKGIFRLLDVDEDREVNDGVEIWVKAMEEEVERLGDEVVSELPSSRRNFSITFKSESPQAVERENVQQRCAGPQP